MLAGAYLSGQCTPVLLFFAGTHLSGQLECCCTGRWTCPAGAPQGRAGMRQAASGEQRKGGISSASKGLRLQGEEVSRATSCWLRLVTGKMFPNNPSVWVSAQPITNFPACSPGGTSLSLGVVHAIGWPHPSRTFSFPGQTHVPFFSISIFYFGKPRHLPWSLLGHFGHSLLPSFPDKSRG